MVLHCTDDRHSLTDSSKLEIGNFACLTVLAPSFLYSIRWEYLSGLVTLVCLVTMIFLITLVCLINPFSLVTPVHVVTLVKVWSQFA